MLHEVKERYFQAMAAEITRHGGKIEKYIGDAIMAVFGLPQLHEDDALRALRAAQGMRQALKSVNVELKARYGVELANRTGINTGEVVASTTRRPPSSSRPATPSMSRRASSRPRRPARSISAPSPITWRATRSRPRPSSR